MISRRSFILLAFLSLGLTVLTACSLAADVTPPPGYATQASLPTPAPAFPAVMPDVDQGAAIYAEKCAPCHGETGLGDGPQSGQLPNPAPAIGSPVVARMSVPAEWFQVVTNGNLERFMPGFSGSLSDAQRWDVLSYVYSLSAPSDPQAAELYQSECAACHGASGKGDGPQAAGLSTRPANLADPALMAQRSANELFQAISGGVSPDMPAYKDQWSEDQIWAVTGTIRSLWLGSGPTGQAVAAVENTPAATQAVESTPQPGEAAPETTQSPELTPQATGSAVTVGTISGSVTNGSGGAIPVGAEVTLHGFDGMSEAYTQKATVADDGSYTFSNVEMPSGRVFLTSVQYNGVYFNSDIAHSDEGQANVTLPLVVFDSSNDASALLAERMHVFFDFTQPDVVQVVELFIVSNPTDKVIVAANPGDALLKFDLPQGATNLQFQNGSLGDRFVQTDTGFGDTESVSPGMGQHQILFGYELPYNRSLSLDLSSPLDVSAAVVMVPTSGIKAQSSQLTDAGQRDVQGMQFHVYSADNLKAGEKLSVKLSGDPQGAAASGGSLGSGSNTEMFVGLGALGVALIVAGLWFYSRRQAVQPDAGGAEVDMAPAAASPEDPDALIDAIIALDDLYRSGNLPEAVYRERRAELKAQLKDKMG